MGMGMGTVLALTIDEHAIDSQAHSPATTRREWSRVASPFKISEKKTSPKLQKPSRAKPLRVIVRA
ncbi:hypothetical protein E4U21_006467 [Claviceps maximensis]|nr:hypothetical protein E4U21_006467 [Claviceps maximensis]